MYAQAKKPHTTQPFTPLTDQEFFYFTRLGREDLLAAYIELKRHCWAGKNTCWPSAERQAQETGRKVATVRRRLEDLEQLGVIRVVHAAETKRRGNRYILTQQEEWHDAHGLQHKNGGEERKGADPDRRRALEGDRPRSAKQIEIREPDQEKTNSRAPVARPVIVAPVATQPRVKRVVAPPIPDDLQNQLLQLGVKLTTGIAATLGRSVPADVERAISCLRAAKRVDNPAGYFLAALKGNWVPPASFTQAQSRKQAETEIRRQQDEVDALARLWQLRLGQTLEDVAGEIRRDLERYRKPLAERVQAWVELGRSEAKASAVEHEHDDRVGAAINATLAAGMDEVLVRARVGLGHSL